MLVALLIYAYACGQRSSRRIERLCAEHVAYRVLCAQDGPDHTTIARHMSALRRVGVPYTDEDIAKAPEAVKGKTEMEALIAYLQGLGTVIR